MIDNERSGITCNKESHYHRVGYKVRNAVYQKYLSQSEIQLFLDFHFVFASYAQHSQQKRFFDCFT